MQSTIRTFIKQLKNSIHHPFSQKFLDDPCVALRDKSSNMNIPGKLLGEIARLDTLFPEVYPSHITLARRFDCSTKTVSRVTQRFVDMGILVVKRRYNDSYKYGLNPKIKTMEMMRILSPQVEFFRKMVFVVTMMPGSFMGKKYLEKMPLPCIESNYKAGALYLNNMISTLVPSEIFDKSAPGGDYISTNENLAPPDVGSITFRREKMETPRLRRLTDEAKLQLIAYPPEIIDEALEKVEKIHGIKNKVRWMQSHCASLCKQRGIQPAWGLAAQLKAQNSMSENPELFKKSIPFSELPVPRIEAKLAPPRHIKRDLSPIRQDEIDILKGTGMWEFLENLKSKAKQREEGLL